MASEKQPKIIQNPLYHLIVTGRFFCYDFSRNGGVFLTIEEYIKSLVDQKIFSGGDTINVGVRKFEPPEKECRGLYCASDWHSNR